MTDCSAVTVERVLARVRDLVIICVVIKLMDVCTCLSNGILIISVNCTRRQITVNEYFRHLFVTQ